MSGILNGALEQRSSTLGTPADWMVDWFTGGRTTSGVKVDEGKALTLSGYYSAVRAISEDVASLPLHLMGRRGRRKSERRTDPRFDLLQSVANPELTALQLRETLQAYQLTRGNAFAEIVRDASGMPRELWPITPTRVTMTRAGVAGGLVYTVSVSGAPDAHFDRTGMLHFKGLSLDGVRGLSLLQLARQSLGLALAAEEYGARFYANDARPGGVLQHPGKLSDPARANIRKSWEDLNRGLEQSHRTAILEEGLKWAQVGISNEDAQFLETRRFQVGELARWFRIPPHMLADLERATFSNVEQQSIDYVQHTLRPWLVRTEQTLSMGLLSADERKRLFWRHKVEGLLRGDTEKRFASYATGRQWGWYSANDIRELEDLNPVAGGDVYLQPLNFVPAGTPPELDDDLPPAPTPTPPGNGNGVPADRVRDLELEERNAARRRSVRASFMPVFEDAAARLIRAESREVDRLVRDHLEQRGTDSFEDALNLAYNGELRELAARLLGPAFRSYADVVMRDALADVERVLDPAALAEFMAALIGAFAMRHSMSSAKQLITVATGALADPAAAIKERLEQWREKRAAQVAMRETVQAAGGVAREAWRQVGVERVRWRASGKNCPLCSRLDGQTRVITDLFVPAGSNLEQEPGTTLMRIRRDVGHPPLHQGCDCTLEPA